MPPLRARTSCAEEKIEPSQYLVDSLVEKGKKGRKKKGTAFRISRILPEKNYKPAFLFTKISKGYQKRNAYV